MLFIGCDVGIHTLANRVRSALLAHAAPASLPFYFLSRPASISELSAISQQAHTVQAGLLILDNPRDLPYGFTAASLFAHLPYLTALTSLAAETRSAVLVLLHTASRRSTLAQGLLAAGAQHVLALDAPFGQPRLHLRTVAALPTQMPISITTTGPYERWKRPRRRVSVRPVSPLGEAGYEALTFLKEGQASTTRLMASLTSATPGRVRNLIKDLVADGYIRRSNLGSRGTPATYEITPAGQDVLRLRPVKLARARRAPAKATTLPAATDVDGLPIEVRRLWRS